MAWLAVDDDPECSELIYTGRPIRGRNAFWPTLTDTCIDLPSGTIEKILGRKLTWEDDPVELV